MTKEVSLLLDVSSFEPPQICTNKYERAPASTAGALASFFVLMIFLDKLDVIQFLRLHKYLGFFARIIR